MVLPIVLLLGSALAVGAVPGSSAWAAAVFTDGGGYAAQTLTRSAATSRPTGWTASGLAWGSLSTALALAVAAVALYAPRHRSPGRQLGRPVLHVLRELHSGHVGDYVAWLLAGVAALGLLVWFPGR